MEADLQITAVKFSASSTFSTFQSKSTDGGVWEKVHVLLHFQGEGSYGYGTGTRFMLASIRKLRRPEH